MADPTPPTLGLCPHHQRRFYVPVSAAGSLRCPACATPMVVYARVADGALAQAVNHELRAAATAAVAHAQQAANGWTFVPVKYFDTLRATLEGR